MKGDVHNTKSFGVYLVRQAIGSIAILNSVTLSALIGI